MKKQNCENFDDGLTRVAPKIKLNHPCEICKNIIYIGEGTIIENRPVHFKCFRLEIENKAKEDFLKMIEELTEETDAGDLGYTPKKIVYVNELKQRLQEKNKNI